MPWIDPDLHGYGFRVACPWCWLREVLRWFTVTGRFLKRLIVGLISAIWKGFKRLAANDVRSPCPASTTTPQRQRVRMISIKFDLGQAGRLISFTLLLAFVTLFTVLFAGMAGYSVLTSVVPPEASVWREIRCVLGLPIQADAKCWQERMSQLESRKAKELAALNAKNKKLDSLQAEANARLKSIGTLEERFDIVNLFSKRKLGNLTVVTGVEYRGLSSGPKWTKAWCYTEVLDRDLALKIALGNATPQGGVVLRNLTSAEQTKLGWTRAANLVGQCQWPDVAG